MKRLFILILAFAMLLAGCQKNEDTTTAAPSTEKETETTTAETTAEETTQNPDAVDPMDVETMTAEITVKDYGTIKLELYPSKAPQTVSNFVSLANQGFYDGTIFHRVIEGFMIQGGDPEGTGLGGPGYSIKGEFESNGFENDIKHDRGVLSMARKSSPLDSAGSQFFIVQEAAPHLDGDYAAFGKVVEGMEIVDEIASCETDANDKPLTDIVIESIKTDGTILYEPEKIK